MPNQWMARELRRGDALDVSRCKRTRDGGYVLPRRMHPPKRKESKDYVDTEREAHIWSIGKNRRTGVVVASLSARYYQRPGWDCLWLR